MPLSRVARASRGARARQLLVPSCMHLLNYQGLTIHTNSTYYYDSVA